jgi:hypothetical protein
LDIELGEMLTTLTPATLTSSLAEAATGSGLDTQATTVTLIQRSSVYSTMPPGVTKVIMALALRKIICTARSDCNVQPKSEVDGNARRALKMLARVNRRLQQDSFESFTVTETVNASAESPFAAPLIDANAVAAELNSTTSQINATVSLDAIEVLVTRA